MEQAVTYPQVAVIYNVVLGIITQHIIPGPGETAHFTVPPRDAVTYLPSGDPALLAQFNTFLTG